MRFKSYWMTALVSAGLLAWAPRADAASNPGSATFRAHCDSPACGNLPASFAGRLEWYSGNVLVFSETGTFARL